MCIERPMFWHLKINFSNENFLLQDSKLTSDMFRYAYK